MFWFLPIKTIVYFLISYISHQIYYILGRGPCWICWKIRAKIAKGSGQTWRYSCLFSTFFLKKENNNNNFFWVKVIQKCFFLERIILTWFFLKILTYVCALPLVLQTNCVLNKNVTRCCRRTWRLPSRIFKTCNIPFSFTYNIVYYSVHIPTYKSWTTSHNLVMGRVSTWKFRCSFYLIIDPSLKNSNFEITELLYNTILKF